MDNLYAIRKANLLELALQKFQGNKSALARAAEVHHNHINLLLSNNDSHRRNMGEDLARRMEARLGLPPLWLDNDHTNEQTATAVIASLPIGEGLDRVLQNSPIHSMTVTISWMAANLTHATPQLFLSCIASDEASPHVVSGDIVIIDAGVKAFTVDGVYLLIHGEDVYLRHIRKRLTGGYTVEGGGSSEQIDNMKGFTVSGRVAQKIHTGRT
jgi:hypothetical protein